MSFASWLRTLKSRFEHTPARRTRPALSRRRPPVRLCLESLEDRTLLSAGSLDLSFGTDGKVSTDFPGSFNDTARVVAVQSDGKVVVVGGESPPENQEFIELARYNTDGNLDTSFGDKGQVVFRTPDPSFVRLLAVALQADNSIVVGSYGPSTPASPFLMRFHPDGTLDAGFNERVQQATPTFQPIALAVSDGKIVALGTDGSSSILVRYNTDGTLDNLFDSDGKVSLDFVVGGATGGYHVTVGAGALAVDAAGRILVGGDHVLARYTSSGAPDSNFDGDGRVTATSAVLQIVVQSDGEIVTSNSSGLTRYSSSGTVLGQVGLGSLIRYGSGDEETVGLALQSDDKILVKAGYSVTRVTADLAPDTSFVGAGLYSPPDSVSYAVAVQPNDRFIVVGRQYDDGRGTGDDFAVRRYLADGNVDTAFGNNGRADTDFLRPGASDATWGQNHMTIQPDDGKLLVVGTSSSYDDNLYNPDFALARYNSDGSLDTGFDGDGRVKLDFASGSRDFGYGVAVQSDGKIVVAGTTGVTFSLEFALARYNSNGTLDTNFGNQGKVISSVGLDLNTFSVGIVLGDQDDMWVAGGNTVAHYSKDGNLLDTFSTGEVDVAAFLLQPDGQIVAAGTVYGTTRDFALARYDSQGHVDPSFHGGAVVTRDFGGEDVAYGVALDSQGRIVLAGSTYAPSSGSYRWALARYEANGSPDTTFNGDGGLTSDVGVSSPIAAEAYAVAVQPDDKIVAAGYAYTDQGGASVLARFNTDGTLDTSFDGDGIVLINSQWDTDLTGVAVQPDGTILTSGDEYSGITSADFLLIRLLGEPDLFSHDGLQAALDGQPPVNPVTGNPTVTLQTSIQTQADAFLALFQDPSTPDFTPLTPSAGTMAPIDIVVTLDSGISVNEADLVIPQGIRVQINGGTWHGGSPALTFSGGDLTITGATFVNSTDAPTILVSGGHLTLRNDIIQESTGFSDAAISITGGTLDLGTATDPGGNTINVNGAGTFLRNTTANRIVAVGDTFERNGQATVWPAPLTVTTRSSLMLVGNSPPPLTGSVNGTPFTGSITYTTAYGDQVTITLSTPATSTSPVGQYAISATLSGASADNYLIDPATSTTGTLYVVSLGTDPTSTTGAKSVVFWDNKGNAKLITAADLSSLDALNLVTQGGAAFDPKSVQQLQAWLSTSPNATTAYQLAVQLAAMDLNVLTGYVQMTDFVYAGQLLSYATAYGITGLTSGGFINVQNLMNAANAVLAQVSPGTPSGDPNQAYEAALAQVLQAANGNTDFVSQEVCWNLTALDLAFIFGV